MEFGIFKCFSSFFYFCFGRLCFLIRLQKWVFAQPWRKTHQTKTFSLVSVSMLTPQCHSVMYSTVGPLWCQVIKDAVYRCDFFSLLHPFIVVNQCIQMMIQKNFHYKKSISIPLYLMLHAGFGALSCCVTRLMQLQLFFQSFLIILSITACIMRSSAWRGSHWYFDTIPQSDH